MNKDDQGDCAQDPTDGELVHRIRSGELAGFDGLVRRYQRRATAIAYRLLSNRDDAMEVVQDAFLKAYDRLDSLTETDRFGSWLLRIVNNLALNRRRSRAIRRMASLDAGDRQDDETPNHQHADPHTATPLEHAAGCDLNDRLTKAIDQLPEMQRQALVMFSIESMPQKQVAEILGCSVEAVKWHVFTARKKLKDLLRDSL